VSRFASSGTSVAGPIGAQNPVVPDGPITRPTSDDWNNGTGISALTDGDSGSLAITDSPGTGERFTVEHRNVFSEITLTDFGPTTSSNDAKLEFRDPGTGEVLGETPTVNSQVTETYTLSKSVSAVEVVAVTAPDFVGIALLDVSVPIMPSHRHE